MFPCFVNITLTLSLLVALLGQSANQPEDAVESERQERLKFMIKQFEPVKIETAGAKPRPLTRMEKPVLRYTNPIRSSSASGATFLWLDDHRPMVAASISIRDNKNVFWEFTSLANEKLSSSQNGNTFWKPNGPNRSAETLRDAPEPSEKSVLRLAQMRDQARRFNVSVERGTWQEIRLLPQPLHRWGAVDSEVLDGALFGFTETTDPEMLLLIEARTQESKGKYSWYFTIAKMTGPPAKVELDQAPLWQSGGYWRNPRSPEDPYMEAAIGTYENKGEK